MVIQLPGTPGVHGTVRNLSWHSTSSSAFEDQPGFSGFHSQDHFFWAPARQLMWVDGRLLSANEYWGVAGERTRWKGIWTSINNSAEAQSLRQGEESGMVDPLLPGDPPSPSEPPRMVSPGDGLFPDDPSDPGEGQSAGVTAISTLGPKLPAVWAILGGTGASMTIGRLISWSSLGWIVKQGLLFLGLTEGFDILIDTDGPGPDRGLFGGGGGGSSSGGDPVGAMVAAMTVSTWDSNGVRFHRLSDGRLAVQNKHGVWKIWRPKKPTVLMPTGATDLQVLLRADAIIQKQAEKIKKVLRNRGWVVRRKSGD